MEAPAAEAALRELEKALTNYQSAEAAATRRSVSCCWPLRSCRHRKRWAAMPHKSYEFICLKKRRAAMSQ